MAKKQVCMIVLIAATHLRGLRHLVGVDDEELEFLVDDGLLDLARQAVPDLIGGEAWCVEQERGAPGGASSSTSSFSRNWNWWQATKLALWMRWLASGSAAARKRRWEMVMAPAFLES